MNNKYLLLIIFTIFLQSFLFAKFDYENEKKAIDNVIANLAFTEGELYVCTKEDVDTLLTVAIEQHLNLF